MIRFRHTQSPGACFSYFLADAKLTDEERRGVWIGHACSSLGVKAGEAVKPLDLAMTLDGYRTDGRRFVRRMPPPGTRRAAYDMVVSPAKAISVAALVGPARVGRLVRDCFASAARDTFTMVESMIRRQGQQHLREWTGRVAAAEFTHEKSRYGDPHLHTHFLMMNVTEDRRGGLWAMTVESAMSCAQWLDRLFQIDLARKLSRAGLASRLENHICVLPVSESIVAKFSKGRRDIDEAMIKVDEAFGEMKPHRRGQVRSFVNDRIRPRRSIERRDWREEAGQAGCGELDKLEGRGVAVAEAVTDRVRHRVIAPVRKAENPWDCLVDAVLGNPGLSSLSAIQAMGLGKPPRLVVRKVDPLAERARRALGGRIQRKRKKAPPVDPISERAKQAIAAARQALAAKAKLSAASRVTPKKG